MDLMAPSYIGTKWYDRKTCSIKSGAPDEIKREYEERFNTPKDLKSYKKQYPEFKNPYMSWTGEIIEKGK